MFKRHAQRGFTLIEILVALAILSVMAVLASSAFDGSRSKAQAMISLGKSVGDANIQLKNDTGCYVNKPHALFDQATAQLAANNYCGATFGNTWSRAYLGQYPVDGNGALVVPKIASGVTVALATGTDANGRTQYSVKFTGVPMDVIKQALVECNNSAATGGSFANNTCMSTADLTTKTPGDFSMLYDTTM